MSRIFPLLAALLVLALSTGCAVASRTSTTERTAVEMALLTQSADASIRFLETSEVADRKVRIDPGNVDVVEGKYLLSSVEEQLLKEGGLLPELDATPEIIVEPRVEYAAIDSSDFLIGIPAFTFAIPGTPQTVETPELAIFAKRTQWGRSQVRLHAREAADGRLVFARAGYPAERYYTRWKLLIFFGFKTTDLGPPF